MNNDVVGPHEQRELGFSPREGLVKESPLLVARCLRRHLQEAAGDVRHQALVTALEPHHPVVVGIDLFAPLHAKEGPGQAVEGGNRCSDAAKSDVRHGCEATLLAHPGHLKSVERVPSKDAAPSWMLHIPVLAEAGQQLIGSFCDLTDQQLHAVDALRR